MKSKNLHMRRIISFIMVLAMMLTMLPASVLSADSGTITLYFRNDWLWTDVCAYYWGGSSEATWPGVAMTYVESDEQDRDIYSVEIPADSTGVIFNGMKDDGSETRDQTPNITSFADGNAFYIHWENDANQYGAFDYTPPTVSDNTDPSQPCTVTLHCGNTVGWSSVYLYCWDGDGNALLGAWPGTKLSIGQDGFYTCSLDVAYGTTVGYIFNSGSAQTGDRSLGKITGDTEKWIKLTQDSDGNYAAKQRSSAYTVAVNPTLDADKKTATFRYAGDASSVCVAGSFNNWSTTANPMAQDSDGVWTATISSVEVGLYEYKFVVDGKNWISDPGNGWKIGSDGNSAFFMPDLTATDSNEITVNVHYSRTDGDYTGWNVYAWGADDLLSQYDFTEKNGEMVASITLDGRSNLSLNFKVRKSEGTNSWAAESSEVYIDLSRAVSGTIDVTVTYDGSSYSSSQKWNSDIVLDNKLSSAELDYDNNVINVTSIEAITDDTAITLVDQNGKQVVANITLRGCGYVLTPSVELDLVNLHQYKIKYDGYPYDIDISTVYASDKFAEEFTYDGDDLGAVWSKNSTTFTVWAPTASAVSVKLYATGSDDEEGAQDKGSYAMTAGEYGVWTVTVNGDLNGTYYTYSVARDGKTVEAADPYARTTGVNGKRGMVIDLDSTDPDGWDTDENPNKITSYTDAIIYELHVRDFSIDSSSGIKNKCDSLGLADYSGKFLAFTLEGTTVNGEAGGLSTGIDYLKSLGVTHIHLLPVYDYGSVDETKCENFNWGYDPVNYNVPEGSYSLDPYHGEVRVKEFKQMVQALHEAGISVIMDVVYNHVYDADAFCFNQIVPGYFSRVNSNRSGCGNDTASEREMVRKYIVESVTYWCEEYHIDGFRFDLVGLIDVETINAIIDSVHQGLSREDVIFYGEGWDMDDTNREPGTDMAKQGNASKMEEFAFFSDSMRNDLGGDNGKSTGFASGAGNGAAIAADWAANPWWTKNPSQIIQYASCHDNYSLIDKLVISTKASGVTDSIISMNNLAAAVYMTAAGIPFIHAGEEMLREKLNEDDTRCENSYNASDDVNSIKWSNLNDSNYTDTVAYYQGLIAFRKAHGALRYSTAAEVSKYITVKQASENLVVIAIDGSGAGEDDIYIIFNAGSSEASVTLPTGTWNVCVDKNDASKTALYTASGTVRVAGVSAMVLTGELPEEEAAETVTLYFTNDQWWSSVYAYAWSGNTYLIGTWPGSAMTWVEKNEYNQDIYAITIPATAQNIIFNNGNGSQTADLTVGVDGTGYYISDNSGNCSTYKYRDPAETGDGYYLFGYINGANYGCVEDYTTLGDYKFVDGTVTVTFDTDSYVGVKTGDNATWYMTDGWLGNVTSATLYPSGALSDADANKLMIPGGVQVTFTLTENADATLTLSYTADLSGAYSDASGIQSGVTLHCWNWSFAEIEANMAKIAEMGFTAIQTSPVQPIKESTLNGTVSGNWWVYYQPVDFTITTADGNALGTKTELKSMIETAHEYGIQVIVDVVANHLANDTGNDLSPQIPNYLQNVDFWHDITTDSDYSTRYNVTQYCMSGLPDLNTANETLQGYVLTFLKDCVDVGVDGFRFDAAKHIETPDDDSTFASDFWPTVIGGAAEYAKTTYTKDLYFYGEVLDSIDGLPIYAYTKYMSVTDNSWGNTLRESIASGNAAIAAGYDKAANASSLVIWAESHDTYANDDGMSKDETTAEINMAWALVAARADAMGLYLARPESNSQALGVASVTGWYSTAVAAVNRFHNAFADQAEAVGNNGSISYVVRGSVENNAGTGIVLVNAKGTSAVVNIYSIPMADGEYIDRISGNIFTVTNGKISGRIGSSGIAVVYGNGVAEIDGQIYDTVQAAIGDAAAGDTVKLLKDTSVTAVELLKGITLDLNGCVLTVSGYVVAYRDNAIIDSIGGGLLAVDKNLVMLQEDNANYLPVWNGDNGYVLIDCAVLNQKTTATDTTDTVLYKFLPSLGMEAYGLLAAGAEASGAQMKVEVSWERTDGTIGFTTFTYSDELISEFYAGYDAQTGKPGKVFALTLAGVGDKELRFKVYFESDTGAVLCCNPDA